MKKPRSSLEALDMARIRTIKPEFWTDEKTGRLSLLAKLLFIGIWNLADDGGVCRANPAYLRGQLFPYSDDDLSLKNTHGAFTEPSITTQTVVRALDEIAAAGLIMTGRVSNEIFLVVNGWHEHQKINRPSEKKCVRVLSSSLEDYTQRVSKMLTEGSSGDRDRDRDRDKEEVYIPETHRVSNPQHEGTMCSPIQLASAPPRDPMGDRFRAAGVGLDTSELKARICDPYPNKRGWARALPTVRQLVTSNPAIISDLEKAVLHLREDMKNLKRSEEHIPTLATFIEKDIWRDYVNGIPGGESFAAESSSPKGGNWEEKAAKVLSVLASYASNAEDAAEKLRAGLGDDELLRVVLRVKTSNLRAIKSGEFRNRVAAGMLKEAATAIEFEKSRSDQAPQ
jgi:hypothetical protein